MDDDVRDHFETVHEIQEKFHQWNVKQDNRLALLTLWNAVLTAVVVYLWLLA